MSAVDFTVHGRLGARDVAIVWKDGAIGGDDEAVVRCHELAESGEMLVIAPPAAIRAGLAEPRQALRTIVEVLDDVSEIEGEVPAPLLVPDDAIA